MSGPLLKVTGASKGFPGVQALQDVDLELRHGEVLALVGENGAGKSTLMKLLSGVYTPDAGEFLLDGAPFAPSGPRDAQERGISIIHQELHLAPDLTIAQNIFLGREPRRLGMVDERRLNRDAAALFERIGIELDPGRRVEGLPVALQQMVEIARALSFDAKVLIMDEPTAALNDAEVAALHRIIRDFVSPTTGVVYISHRMEEISAITDRITVLRDGRLVGSRDTRDTGLDEVITMMVGREVDMNARPEDVRAARETLVEVRGLTTPLLKDVSFEIRTGEILAFAGLMGAGRTETARALVGADPSTGQIRVRGRQVSIPNPAKAAALGIGYLSEDRKGSGLLLDQTVRDNIALGRLPRLQKAGLLDERAITARAKEYVESLRVRTPSIRQEVQYLSGGNQQKVVIAKWLLADCDVLIFDEPTRGIDVGAKDEIYALLRRLADQGKAIVVISSELPEVLRLAHRILVMSEGRITGELSAADATQERIMRLATQEMEDVIDHDLVQAPHTPTTHPTTDRGEDRA